MKGALRLWRRRNIFEIATASHKDKVGCALLSHAERFKTGCSDALCFRCGEGQGLNDLVHSYLLFLFGSEFVSKSMSPNTVPGVSLDLFGPPLEHSYLIVLDFVQNGQRQEEPKILWVHLVWAHAGLHPAGLQALYLPSLKTEGRTQSQEATETLMV